MRLRSRLALARVQQGLTQYELASIMAVSQATLSLWEVGHRLPKPEDRRRLAEFLSEPESVLFPETL